MPFDARPYAPRPTRFVGLVEHGGWRIKRYAITLPGVPFDPEAYEPGLAVSLGALPTPAVTPARPGVGYMICHTGFDADGRPIHFMSVFWWDNRNELVTDLVVRGARTGDRWVRGEGFGIGCVWDLLVIEHERAAFVRHLLTASPDPEAYLANVTKSPV